MLFGSVLSCPWKVVVLIATLLLLPWIASAGVDFQVVAPEGPLLAVISKISLPIRLLPTRKLLRYPPEPSAPPVAPRK
jgi:hypothetical protein